MNRSQMGQQIAHLLRAARWPEGDAHLLFRDVFVGLGDPDPSDLPDGWAWAWVSIKGGTQVDEVAGLQLARFEILFAADGTSPRYGGGAVTGGSITALGRAANRGVEEIASRVSELLDDLTVADGSPVNVQGADGVEARPASGNDRSVAFGRLELQATCTLAPFFTGVEELSRSGSSWTWRGAAARARWDFSRFELWTKPGTAPQYPGDGTLLGTSSVDSLTAAANGQVATLFATYSSRRNALRDGYSPADRGNTLRP